MQLFSLLSFFLFARVQAAGTTITQCDPEPTNTLATTPYTIKTQTMFANGKSIIGVVEYYQSIEYTKDCGDVKPVSSSVSAVTVPVY